MSTVLAVARPRANLLANPGFEAKSRPAASFVVNGTNQISLDCWRISCSGGNLTVDRIGSTIGSSGLSLRAVKAGGTGNAAITQQVERPQQLRGQLVTCACWVKSTVSGALRLRMTSVGSADSLITDGTLVFQANVAERLVHSHLVIATANLVRMEIFLLGVDQTIELNDATLCLGGVPLDYYPPHWADDTRRCQRQYEKHGGAFRAVQTRQFGAAGGMVGTWVSYATPKLAVPTVTKVGTWNLISCNQPLTYNLTTGGYVIAPTTTGTASVTCECVDATTYVTAEANP